VKIPLDNLSDSAYLPHMLTLAQAAALLGLAHATLRSQVGKGRMTARMIGKTWVVSEGEVERYRAESLGKRIRRTP